MALALGDPNNQLLFIHIGDAARESGYGHMIIPLPTDQLAKVTDVLGDMMGVRTKYGGDFNSSYGEIERYGILRVKEKVELILSLASREGFIAKELQMDEVNSLKAAMKDLDRKKRSVTVAILTAIFGVAAFGTAFHSWASMNQVKDTLNTGLQKQDALIEEVDAQLLRVADVTNFVARQYNEIVTHVKELEHLTRREIANRLDHFLHLMLTSFRLGLQDFMAGLTDLMNHRLSPLLVTSANLEAAFEKLVESAQRQGLKPLTRDVGILFQAATSTFADANGRLFAVVHVPLYTGERLHLYKYIPAPFFLEEHPHHADGRESGGIPGSRCSPDRG